MERSAKERIKKLRRLAADPGAFPGEAANATKLADKLEAELPASSFVEDVEDWASIEDDWDGARYTSQPYRERRWPGTEERVWYAAPSGVVHTNNPHPGMDFANIIRKRSPFG